MDGQNGPAIKELHRDLARKFRMHGPQIEVFWKSFTKDQRTKAVRYKQGDGVVLKHRMDTSKGNLCKFVPELNLRDLLEPGDYLLDLLRNCATTSLMEQYYADRDHIMEMTRTRKLRHIDEARLNNSFTTFLDDAEGYGQCLPIARLEHQEEMPADVQSAIAAGKCVPQATAELIFTRQAGLLQSLNIIIEDILKIGSTTKTRKPAPPPNTYDATVAMTKLSVQARPTKLSVAELLGSARDQKMALGDYLDLLIAEPVVLAHAVNHAFISRPELIPDKSGFMLPVRTNRPISSAFFEAVNDALKALAIWNYLYRLLDLLKDCTDETYRAAILQEISNACHLEYNRTQSVLKRHVHTSTGTKYFRKVANVFENGFARVTMKVRPEELSHSNPQMSYMLHLCQTSTTAAQAIAWLDKLDKLHATYADQQERISDREYAALGDHAAIVAFIQDLGPGISMPSLSPKKGQLFVSRSKDLEGELNEIRDQLDLTEFVVTIDAFLIRGPLDLSVMFMDQLLKPGIAQSALEALAKAVTDKTGMRLGSMYRKIIEDCLAGLEKQYQPAKTEVKEANVVEKKNQVKKTDSAQKQEEPVSAFIHSESSHKTEQRRQKEKTRPTHSFVFDFAPGPAAIEKQVFIVKPSTVAVFTTLFDNPQSRGAVSWASFKSAMADLGFSVCPKLGSIYTFLPSSNVSGGQGMERPLTIHRPHTANIEGYLLLIYARRLSTAYGWDKDSFRVEAEPASSG